MEMQTRKITLQSGQKPLTLDEENRSVQIVAASETPVRTWVRGQGMADEVLLMSGVNIPDTRQVPLLNNHSRSDTSDVLGSARELRVDGNQLISRVIYSELAQEPWQLLKEGHLTDYSAGFIIDKSIWIPEDQEAVIDGRTFNGPVSVVTEWTLKEVSTTPIGADHTAKARSNRNEKINIKKEEINKMEPEEKQRETPAFDVNAEREKIRNAENERIREISAIAAKWKDLPNILEDAQRAIKEGVTLDKFRAETMSKIAESQPVKTPEIGMGKRDLKKYSILKAVRAMATNRYEDAGLELEASRAAEDQFKRSPRGMFIPYDVMIEKRDLTVSNELAAGMTVANDIRWGSMIDKLRNKMALTNLGATMVTGLVGDVTFPKDTTDATMYWINEGEDASETAGALGQISMTPKTGACYTDFTRKLLMQTSFDVEMWARNKLISAIALGFDYAGLHGTGLDKTPRGVEYTPDINTVIIGATGGNPTWANIVNFETQIAIDNADIGSMAYLTNAKVRGYLKTKDRGTDTGVYLWNTVGLGDGMLNGYRAVVSNQVRSDYTKTTTDLSAMFFGVWSKLLIGQWGPMDISVSKSALEASGGTRIYAFNDVDYAVTQPLSFCFCKDIKTV